MASTKSGAVHTPFKAFVHTITADNGLEFAQHEFITRALQADVYFAKPYASWQRGSNENLNGLIREYFPKGKRLDQVKEQSAERRGQVLHCSKTLDCATSEAHQVRQC